MNAPALTREDFRSAVTSVLPLAQGAEIEARCALLFIQARAIEARDQCGIDAYAIFDHVERLTRLYAFARVPVEALNHLRESLRQLVTTAGHLDQFTQLIDRVPDHTPEVDDARG